MKRELDRYKDKLTSEEERHIWGRMKSALREDKASEKPWTLGLWLSRAAIVAGTAMLAVAIWHAGNPPTDTTFPEAPLQPDWSVAGKTEPRKLTGPDDFMTDGLDAIPSKTQLSRDASTPAPISPDASAPAPISPDASAPVPMSSDVISPTTTQPLEIKTDGTQDVEISSPSPDPAGAPQPEEAPVDDASQLREKPVDVPSDDDIIAHRRAQPVMLANAGEIRGWVVNEYGEPMPHIQITLDDTPWGTTVKDDGSFRIRNVPAGNYTLNVMKTGFRRVNLANLAVNVAESLELNVELVSDSPFGRVCGRILDSNDKPITGARVSVRRERGHAVSADDGSFCIQDVPVGLHKIKVSMRGYDPLVVEDIEVERGLETNLVANLMKKAETSRKMQAKVKRLPETPEEAKAAEELLKRNLKLLGDSTQNRIYGRVLDEEGNPVAYAQVVVLGEPWGAMGIQDGTYIMKNVYAGTYELKVMMMGYEEETVPNIVVRDGEETRVDFTISKTIVDLGLDEVVVKGRRQKITKKETSQTHASRSEESTSLPVDELEEAISLKAGVVTEAGELHLRGGRDGGVQYSIEGTESEQVTPPPPPVPSDFVAFSEPKSLPADKPPYGSTTGGSRPVNDGLADDMFFEHYGVNPFVAADEDALSTFALDVDTGSYTMARRYIREGNLPPQSAIRVEEFVNFVRKNYDPPKHGDFSIRVVGMPSPFAHVQDGSYQLVRVGIRGRVVDSKDREPVQIVLVIDTSGSMRGQNRIGLLKSSMDILLDEMKPDDEIGIVEFGSKARVILPMTSLEEEEKIHRAIHSLRPNGSTNVEHGLQLGYEMLREAPNQSSNQRIILCSDGVANTGNTGWERILDNVKESSDRIMLTTIGFGMGNYNDVLMEQLADAGDGQYAYVDGIGEATRVLRENITGLLQIIARDTKAQIEFNPEIVERYRLIGYENRDVRDEDFRDNTIDAGEIGAGHEVTVLYEVKLKDRDRQGRLATVRLRYEKPEGDRFVELEEVVQVSHLVTRVEDAAADLVFDACVAEFAEILRGSYWAKESTLAPVLDLARDAIEKMTSRPDLDEIFIVMEKAASLSDAQDDR